MPAGAGLFPSLFWSEVIQYPLSYHSSLLIVQWDVPILFPAAFLSLFCCMIKVKTTVSFSCFSSKFFLHDFKLFSFISVSGKSKKCKDVSRSCKKKAKQGWCSKNQSYAAMGRKCQLACKMCNKSKSKVLQ